MLPHENKVVKANPSGSCRKSVKILVAGASSIWNVNNNIPTWRRKMAMLQGLVMVARLDGEMLL